MKISIITTTYNSASTLTDTLKSIFKQSYDNFESVIIDGKSTDGTLEIIKSFKNKYPNKIKYISEKDKGIYDAMNKGISLATGDIIGILNSDDFFTSNDILETIAKTFSENDIDAIYGDVHFVNNNNLKKCIRYYSSRIFSPSLMRLGFMPAHPSFYIKNYQLKNVGKYNTSYKIAADFEFLLRAFLKNKIRSLYIPKDFVTMRIGGASTSGISSRKLIMKEHLRALKENNIYSNFLFLSLRYIYKIGEVLFSRIYPY